MIESACVRSLCVRALLSTCIGHRRLLRFCISDRRLRFCRFAFAMAAWKHEFQKLYDDATSSGDGKTVQLVDRMMSILKANGQSQIVLLPNACVGLRPENRGGGLLSYADCHSKGAGIKSVGFAFKLCGPERAVCSEVSPTSNHIQDWTAKLSESSEHFAELSPSSIKVGSVGCSHLVAWLNCITAGVLTRETSLCRPNGDRMSKAMLVEAGAVLGKALNEGLYWTMINAEVGARLPSLPRLGAEDAERGAPYSQGRGMERAANGHRKSSIGTHQIQQQGGLVDHCPQPCEGATAVYRIYRCTCQIVPKIRRRCEHAIHP